MILNECKVNCLSEVSADIARVEIVASLRVTYTTFHNLSIENSALWCFIAVLKVAIPRPSVESSFNARAYF